MTLPYRSNAIGLATILFFSAVSPPASHNSAWAQAAPDAQTQSPGAQPDATPHQGETEKQTDAAPEGSMTLERMGEIIRKLDAEAENQQPNVWQFKIAQVPVLLVADKKHNRMRLLVSVRKTDTLSKKELLRIMQANFDTALDARYAIARNILWATYIHSLSTLHDRQFITAIGQTVNLALTFGTTYSSGALTFQGGDSRDILRRQLIDQLLKKGMEI